MPKKSVKPDVGKGERIERGKKFILAKKVIREMGTGNLNNP